MAPLSEPRPAFRRYRLYIEAMEQHIKNQKYGRLIAVGLVLLTALSIPVRIVMSAAGQPVVQKQAARNTPSCTELALSLIEAATTRVTARTFTK
jgi:glycine cleavage system pyridoxal-binding protein P